MTDFLIRRFIKKYHKVDEPEVRRQYDLLACIVISVCDFILFALKFLMGVITGASAISADAYDDMAGIIRTVITTIRRKIYGREKVSKKNGETKENTRRGPDYIISLILAVIVFEIGFSYFRNAFTGVFKEKTLTGGIGIFILMILIAAVKVYLSSFELKVGRIVKRDDIIKTALTGKRDLTVTFIAFGALVITRFTRFNLDNLATLFTSVMVIWAAVCIAKDTISPLIKEDTDPMLARNIKVGITDYSGIIGVHDLVIKNYGKDRTAASIYAEVSVEDEIEESRKKLDMIERELGKKLGITLIIHMDLVETKDIAALKARMALEKIVANIDERLSFSCFHLLRGEHVKNLIFDMNVPYDYDAEDKRELEEKISRRIRDVDPVYTCIINMDQSRK